MMRTVRIKGLGVSLPKNHVSNLQLPRLDKPLTAEQLDALGIYSRTRADDEESVVAMALAASRKALAEANVEAGSLDFVLLANWSERRYVPDVAPVIQYELGANRAFAYDLCGACCGFLYGLSSAWGYLQNPRFRRGLVVASDRSSRRMRPGSRATLVFGDGAAAAVVDNQPGEGWKIVDYELRTDGSRNQIMEIDADGYLEPHIRQRELNPLAGRTMAESALALLERNHLTLEQIDYVVPHSGTAGVQQQLLEHLGVPSDKVLTNLPQIGNLTTASIPCSMKHFLEHGPLEPRHTVLSVAVGLGWQHVAMLFQP
jgi:3-oxoacyl-[acyl-carrier-protein] synthase-3